MKKLLVIGCWLLVCFELKAHPGIGIIKNSKGNIFYTDLKQVWKVTPDGKKTNVISGVHTHELYIDQQDNLYSAYVWPEKEDADFKQDKTVMRRIEICIKLAVPKLLLCEKQLLRHSFFFQF